MTTAATAMEYVYYHIDAKPKGSSNNNGILFSCFETFKKNISN